MSILGLVFLPIRMAFGLLHTALGLLIGMISLLLNPFILVLVLIGLALWMYS